MGWLDNNIPGYKQVSGAIDTGYKKSGAEGLVTGVGDILMGTPAQPKGTPQQRAQWEEYLKNTPGLITDAQKAQGKSQGNAVTSLGYGISPTNIGQLSAVGLPQAQTSGFNISGAPQYSQVTSTGGGIPVTEATQQLNATMGNLGQYVAGAGAGTSAATVAQSAAMDEQQKIAMANALGQLKEQGFTGAATAGGMGNLGAMAAAQSAGDFARQKAGLLESERNAALSAMGQQGQIAGTLGNLGLGVSGQQLQADTANQDAAIRAAQLAQSGDIAGAELALKGTGLNMQQAMDLNRINTERSISNQNAQMTAAGIVGQNARAAAGIQAQSPEMQALQAQLAFGNTIRPEYGTATPGLITQGLNAVVKGGGEELGKQLVS